MQINKIPRKKGKPDVNKEKNKKKDFELDFNQEDEDIGKTCVLNSDIINASLFKNICHTFY